MKAKRGLAKAIHQHRDLKGKGCNHTKFQCFESNTAKFKLAYEEGVRTSTKSPHSRNTKRNRLSVSSFLFLLFSSSSGTTVCPTYR
jgi:hypothetical protein